MDYHSRAFYARPSGRFLITIDWSRNNKVKFVLEKTYDYERVPVQIAIYSSSPRGVLTDAQLVQTKLVSPSVTSITVPAVNAEDIAIISFAPKRRRGKKKGMSDVRPPGINPAIEYRGSRVIGLQNWRDAPESIVMGDIRDEVTRQLLGGFRSFGNDTMRFPYGWYAGNMPPMVDPRPYGYGIALSMLPFQENAQRGNKHRDNMKWWLLGTTGIGIGLASIFIVSRALNESNASSKFEGMTNREMRRKFKEIERRVKRKETRWTEKW